MRIFYFYFWSLKNDVEETLMFKINKRKEEIQAEKEKKKKKTMKQEQKSIFFF